MKQFFSNRASTNQLPSDQEVLNLLFHEIKNTQNFFPSEKLQMFLERYFLRLFYRFMFHCSLY